MSNDCKYCGPLDGGHIHPPRCPLVQPDDEAAVRAWEQGRADALSGLPSTSAYGTYRLGFEIGEALCS